MALQYLFDPNKQFQSIGGVNEVGGFLRVFLNGTDDRATTYKNFDGTLNEADIVFDTYGRAVVIVDDTKTYRLEVYNRLGGLMWTVSNYKARGGSGGGSTPVEVEGTAGEIDVDENEVGGVKHFIVSLAENVKNAISSLTSAVNGLALSLGNKKERQTAKEFIGSTTKTVVGVSQNEDGEMSVSFGDIPLYNYELNENKKTTVTSYEGSNTYYPTIKAVVDFVNGMMQNLGGKLITDNGDPFASSSALPTTTPYQGVDIADKDYAYIQGIGTAERWSATVTGTSVAWVQEYAISIPVFTPSQQEAIDSGITATILGNLLTKTGDGSNVTATFTAAGSRTNISTGEKLSVIFGKIAKWFGDLKALAFRDTVGTLQIEDDSVTAAKVKDNETFPVHISGTAESSKRFNDEVGTSGVDGHRAIFGGIDSGNNVKIAMSERTGGVSKATEITPSGISTTGGMIIGGDIIIGGSNPATDVKDNSNLAVLIASKANKASSGNGNLAVIDANGNYASSGIGAYAQSQLNSAITNSVIPWLTNNSYIVTHSFWIQANTSVVGQAIDFVNSYTGENLLRITVSYDYNDGNISFTLIWSNPSWNGWIIENPDPQSTAEVGVAIITANGTKHTSNSSSDTVTPFYKHTAETIHSNNVSQTNIGMFNVGKSTMYDTSSYYDFVITLLNGLSSKMATLKISMAIDRYVSGNVKANIIGMATIDASGLNI